MSDADVVVIGAGLAGLLAAVTAAQRGRRTTLIGAGVGAIAIGSGTIDLLGATGDGRPVRGFADGFARLPPAHPYVRVGAAAVAEALAAFQEVCRSEAYGYVGGGDGGAVVATAAGTYKPSGLVPRTMDASALGSGGPVVVVGIPGLKDCFPRLVRDALAPSGAAGEAWTVADVEVAREEGARRDLSALDVARALDAPEGRERFAAALRAVVRPGTTALLPPILGTAPSYAVADALEAAVGCRLLEVAGMPPDPSGFRLWRLLTARARRLGVAVVENATVTGAAWDGRRCRAVRVGGAGPERAFAAERFVLATGGFLGGGLVSEPGAVREPIFDLPLEGPTAGEAWGASDLFAQGGQPFSRVGVRTNSALQPVGEDGAVAVENVLVAGRSLGGFDASLEKSGNGVAVVTGYCAGMRA